MFAALAAVANLIGGVVLIRQRRQDRPFLEVVLSIGAGFMLAAALLAMLPESLAEVDRARWGTVLLTFLAGYLLVQISEHTLVRHFHFGEETHHEEMLGPRVHLAALAGLGVHTLFDGASIGAGFRFSQSLGILIFLAVALHKLPEGFTMASISLASGRSPKAALGAVTILAAATLIGAFGAGVIPGELAPYALAASAGVTLYVAASDLIPEVNASAGVRCSILVFVGVALFWATRELLGLAGIGH
ncbi:MAG: ZIP family metal transporter [Armatimonadetes bacterium]|nr:ZIP family metal transporter [Armatimonadota bacterium]